MPKEGPYIPSDEEIKIAENAMEPLQGIRSELREEQLQRALDSGFTVDDVANLKMEAKRKLGDHNGYSFTYHGHRIYLGLTYDSVCSVEIDGVYLKDEKLIREMFDKFSVATSHLRSEDADPYHSGKSANEREATSLLHERESKAKEDRLKADEERLKVEKATALANAHALADELLGKKA